MDNMHIDILQQYVDDELAGPERVELARHLGVNAYDRALVETYQSQNEALQRCYGDKVHEALPPALKQFVDHWDNRPAEPAATTGSDDASASEHPLLATLIQQAVQAHEFYSGSDGQPMLYDSHQEDNFHQWFEDRLQVRLYAPAFKGLGYSFANAQRLPMAGGTAGHLTHRHSDGSLLMTYFQVLNDSDHASDPLNASVIQQKELAIYYWQYETILYALVAAMHRDKLAKLAKSLLAGMA